MSLKEKVNDIIYDYFYEIMNNYNQTALLLNSCEKAATYYHSKSSRLVLDTTHNIPLEFRLESDIGTVFTKKELIEQYEKKLLLKIVKDYLIATVATLDGLMEDLYEEILRDQEKDKTDEQIKKMVKWGENQLPYDLITRVPKLQTHTNPKGFKLEDFLLTYEYLRQIRHAVIHCKGNLQRRHLNKMNSLEEKMNEKQKMSVKQFHDGQTVKLNPLTTYILRHWCLTFISFLAVAMRESLS
jgi:hypothetical protein